MGGSGSDAREKQKARKASCVVRDLSDDLECAAAKIWVPTVEEKVERVEAEGKGGGGEWVWEVVVVDSERSSSANEIEMSVLEKSS